MGETINVLNLNSRGFKARVSAAGAFRCSYKLMTVLLAVALVAPTVHAGSIWKVKNSGRLHLFTTKEVVWKKHDLIHFDQ